MINEDETFYLFTVKFDDGKNECTLIATHCIEHPTNSNSVIADGTVIHFKSKVEIIRVKELNREDND